MLEVVARLVLGGVLAGAGIAKLASPASSRAALATFGIDGRRAQAVAWALLICVELGLAAGVIAGSATAAYLAAALMATFAATMVGAILRGRAGAPCACFGARSKVGWPSVARNAVLAAAFVALPALPDGDLTTDEWLGLGLAVALLGCAGLAVAVLALAREVGLLRLRLGSGSALEIAEEGPPVFSAIDLVSRFRLDPETTIALAVFVSDGCHVCRSLEPSIRLLDSRPAGRGGELRGGAATRRSGASSESRAARSPSRSTAMAPSSRRAPSTTSPSWRVCSRPPSAGAASATWRGG